MINENFIHKQHEAQKSLKGLTMCLYLGKNDYYKIIPRPSLL